MKKDKESAEKLVKAAEEGTAAAVNKLLDDGIHIDVNTEAGRRSAEQQRPGTRPSWTP